MTQAEKIQFTLDVLEQLYPETPVPLNHKDPFTLLVAVDPRAQCTDERENKNTTKLIEETDNTYDIAK